MNQSSCSNNVKNGGLSKDQEYTFQKFKRGENLFITGPGGTGKTRLIKHLVNYMESRAIKYQVCAMTGCAALLLGCNARTIHSWSGIKLARGTIETVIAATLRNKKSVKAWKSIKVLIVDEVSMMSKKIFELLDRLARIIKKDASKPFGGIQVIFTGDFFQLPPVGNEMSEGDTVKFAFESDKWFDVFPLKNNVQLTTIFRQTDQEYIDILLEIRRGEISEKSIETLKKYVKRDYNKDDHNGTIPTKLFPVKSKVEFVNNAMFSKLENDETIFNNIERTNYVTYVESDKLIEPETLQKCRALSPQEIAYELESMNKNVGIEKQLKLKCGALVMCTYNIDLENGICNGSQGIIVDFKETADLPGIKLPVVLFSNGSRRVIQYQYWQHEEYPSIVVAQIPLCLAWALTIHKIQGATLEMADMDLGKSIFEYGQVYVALSRIRSLNGLYISEFYPHRVKANPIVKEFYNSLLTDYEDINNTIEVQTENIFEKFAMVDDDPTIKRIKY